MNIRRPAVVWSLASLALITATIADLFLLPPNPANGPVVISLFLFMVAMSAVMMHGAFVIAFAPYHLPRGDHEGETEALDRIRARMARLGVLGATVGSAGILAPGVLTYSLGVRSVAVVLAAILAADVAALGVVTALTLRLRLLQSELERWGKQLPGWRD